MDAGYGIEVDLQQSRDERAMVFHDDGLERLTSESGAVRDRDAADLRRVVLTGSEEKEGIPSFAEVLELIKGRVPLLVELKDQSGDLGPSDGRLEAAVAADLAGYEGDVALMSFNPSQILRLAELLPERPRGLVTCGFKLRHWPELATRRRLRSRLRGIPDYEATGACFVSHRYSDLDRARIADLKEAGARILCWTVRTAEQERAARKLADNITFEGYLPDFPP